METHKQEISEKRYPERDTMNEEFKQKPDVSGFTVVT
jgi:hypothetical protein